MLHFSNNVHYTRKGEPCKDLQKYFRHNFNENLPVRVWDFVTFENRCA